LKKNRTTKNQLKNEDIIIAILFIVVMSVILVGYLTAIIDQSVLNKLVSFESIAFSLYLFLLYFERLRIWWIFLFWVSAGILHLIILSYLTNSGNFEAYNGHYSDGGLSILAALMAFLIGQMLNFTIFRRNFVAGAWYSPNTERKKDVFDIVITLIGMFAILISWDTSILFG
jgi:hypothetical protein